MEKMFLTKALEFNKKCFLLRGWILLKFLRVSYRCDSTVVPKELPSCSPPGADHCLISMFILYVCESSVALTDEEPPTNDVPLSFYASTISPTLPTVSFSFNT